MVLLLLLLLVVLVPRLVRGALNGLLQPEHRLVLELQE